MKKGTVHHVAQLAQIPITDDEEKKLERAFDETLKVVDKLQELDVSAVEPTHQVTGLVNILREDVVEESRMFSQAEALANAKHTHNGFFVVNQLIDQS
jgi:aspartyl-tRNA(Asn)/glutamyl-tRNA(Gln) amidotransferase subunit C